MFIKYSRIIIFTLGTFIFLNYGWNNSIYPIKKTAKKTENCRKKLMGVYEFDDYGIRLIIITRKSELYFRNYPENYSVNRATWLGKCKFKLTTVSIHDDPDLSNERVGNEWVSDYYKIDGNKFYYRNYNKGEMTNFGYIIKKTSKIPAKFKSM